MRASSRRLVLATCAAWGVAGLATPLQLDEARHRAIAAGPEVARSRLKAQAGKADVDAARTWDNPSLSLGTAAQTARLSTGVALPLLVFGQRGFKVDAAAATAEALVEDVRVAAAEARWGATQAWLDLWEAGAKATLLASAAQDAAQLERAARGKREAGAGSALDLLRTQAEARRSASEAAQADSAVAAASARLGPVLGAAPDRGLTAAGDPGSSATLASLEALLARLERHPTILRDRAAARAAIAAVDFERRSRWPKLDATVTVNSLDPTLPGPDVQVGLSFEVPILNQRTAAIARGLAEQASAELELGADERRLRATVLEGWERTHALTAHLEVLHAEVVPALEQAKTLTDEAFRLGTVDLLRVLDARKALLESRLAEVSARAAWARAAADLERALGEPLEESN